jgi:exo-beta-1,3-glucanase (GH17 family)
MFNSTSRHSPRLGMVTFVLILTTLLTGCGGTSPNQPTPTLTRLPSPSSNPPFACDQPAPAKSNVTLAGLAYGPYHTGQNPNYFVFPSNEEVAADMPTLASLTNYIRIYSSTGPAEAIIHEAEKTHLCVNLGIWLGKYPTGTEEANAREMAAGEQLASSTAVRALTVGNEVLLRGDMSEGQLIAAIEQVRAHLRRKVPITTADTYDQWLKHPNLARHVDFITVHIYPFWQKQSIDSAMQALDAAYNQVKKAYPDKQIVIGETGWPSDGPPQGAAIPSAANQARYFREFVSWAQSQKVLYFYFDAFDEEWKGTYGNGEFGVGAHWGLYQQDGTVKPALSDVLPVAANVTLSQRSYRDVYVGSGLEEPFGLGIDTSTQQRHWLTANNGSLLLVYPSAQLWGAMFITMGPPVPPGNRPSFDLSAYHSISFDMRAGADGQCVRLGIKDRTQPDDGSEITVQQCLTTQWSTVTLSLDAFANVDLTHLYVVLEVVFQGTSSETVELGNIRYSPTSVPPPSSPKPQSPFNVYTDLGDPGTHYVPTGWMGDYKDITMTQDWTANPHSGRTCIRVVYSGAASQGNGWAGVYWQDPVNNWGNTPGPIGYNLSNLSKLTFWVRGERGGEKIEFKVGGITGPYGDSLQPAVTTGVLTLTTSWQQVTIDLTGKNLTHIIGGFVWVANTTNNPNGATFYLDDIVYST